MESFDFGFTIWVSDKFRGFNPKSKIQNPKSNYRFENWNRFRAPFCPYFFRSFARGSRVTNPAFLRRVRNSGLRSISARVIP